MASRTADRQAMSALEDWADCRSGAGRGPLAGETRRKPVTLQSHTKEPPAFFWTRRGTCGYLYVN